MSKKFIYQISSQYHKRRERKVWKTYFLQRAITHVNIDETRQKSNFCIICIMSRQIHILNFKSVSQKLGEKSPKNWIFAKGNNWSKSWSTDIKVKLDLYHVKTKSYTKFQVNALKDDWEKFGKPSGRTPSGLTDGQTDRRRGTLKSPGFTGRGLITTNCKLSNHIIHLSKNLIIQIWLKMYHKPRSHALIYTWYVNYTYICICTRV